jgi:hypothetical protein
MRSTLPFSIPLFLLACLLLCSSAAPADEGSQTALTEDDVRFIRFWEGVDPLMKMSDLVAYCAPVFWFSPDEPELHNKQGKEILIPSPFPFDESADSPVVYYQVGKVIVSKDDNEYILEINETNPGNTVLDLSRIYGLDIDYNHYYRFESGLGGHDHDTEQAQFKVYVHHIEDPEGVKKYQLYLLQVTGKAHALMWYDNIYKVNRDNLNPELVLPFHIFVEEGKHASITDMNADGYYTPGYDVNVRRNDAWGLRDVIRTGNLFSPEFKGWMAKVRRPPHRVFPPLPLDSPHRAKYSRNGEYAPDNAIYELRPMPSSEKALPDLVLAKDMEGYYREGWPQITSVSGDKKFHDWWEAENFIHSLAVAFRLNDVAGISFSFPLLFVKNVEAPLVGGWLVNRIYLQDHSLRDFGYNILYTPSASRFLDGYLSFGLEVDHYNIPDVEELQRRTDFVYETGIKLRGNVKYSPLKFLSVLTEFWGVRLGVKARGFMKIDDLSYVFEFGAGVW